MTTDQRTRRIKALKTALKCMHFSAKGAEEDKQEIAKMIAEEQAALHREHPELLKNGQEPS